MGLKKLLCKISETKDLGGGKCKYKIEWALNKLC